MQALMGTRFPGVLQLIVVTCSFTRKMTKRGFSVCSVKNSTVWTAGVSGIKICRVWSIRCRRLFPRMINFSWILLREKSLNSVLNVSSGSKRPRDVIIWNANAHFNSATSVEVSIWSANALKKPEKNYNAEEFKGSRVR